MNAKVRYWLPFVVAVSIALLVAVFYVLSGRENLDQNIRQLQQQSNVEKAADVGSNTIQIKCKNGESYEIVYKQGQTSFQDLVYNKCGEQGTF